MAQENQTQNFYIYRGPLYADPLEGEHCGRVLMEWEASPTGFTSMTGVFPTGEAAMEKFIEVVGSGALGWENTTLLFYDLDTRELLREVVVGAGVGSDVDKEGGV